MFYGLEYDLSGLMCTWREHVSTHLCWTDCQSSGVGRQCRWSQLHPCWFSASYFYHLLKSLAITMDVSIYLTVLFLLYGFRSSVNYIYKYSKLYALLINWAVIMKWFSLSLVIFFALKYSDINIATPATFSLMILFISFSYI